MGKKYFAWSFDDGLQQDKKIIEILKEYGLGATFHLNSGLFGDKTYEGRIGNLGMTEMPAAKYEAKARHLLPYVPHFRIPADAPESAAEIIELVYQALKAKGHDPIMQLVGYIISGDPTYITSYNNARSLIRRLERDELLEEFVRFYVVEHDKD